MTRPASLPPQILPPVRWYIVLWTIDDRAISNAPRIAFEADHNVRTAKEALAQHRHLFPLDLVLGVKVKGCGRFVA